VIQGRHSFWYHVKVMRAKGLAEAFVSFLAPIRERYQEIRQDQHCITGTWNRVEIKP
jgi:hypothetical protein